MRGRRWGAVVAVLACALLAPAAPAAAATARYVAVGGSDTGNTCAVAASPCATISHAVAVATNGDTINVGAGTFHDRVTIPSGLGATTLTVLGSPAGTVVDGSSGGSVFVINAAGHVTLSQLDITHGGGPAQAGGGVANSGTTTLVRSAVHANDVGLFFGFGEGGGIDNAGTMTIRNSTIANNNAFGNFGVGGGIDTSGPLTIVDSTIASNHAQVGGGLSVSGSGAASTSGTIFADNTTANCDGVIGDGGHNIDDGTSCQFGSGSLSSTDPALGPLAANGGPTPTMAIGPSSPAVDAGAPTCSATDQRGVVRPQGPACDIGAYELIAAHRTQLVANPAVLTVGPGVQPFVSFSARLTDLDAPGPIAGQTIRFTVDGKTVCTAITDGTGTATCGAPAQVISAVRKLGYTALFAGTAQYAPSSAHGDVIVVGPVRR